MAGSGEGIPGEMEPSGTGEELVGKGVGFEEVDESLELGRILRTDVGSLAYEVLRVLDATYFAIDSLVTEA